MAGENLSRTPKNITWVRNEVKPVTFYTDTNLDDATLIPDRAKKIAWLIEPPSISDAHYYKAFRLMDRFEHVLSFNKDFIRNGNNWLYYPFGGSWIPPEQWGVPPNKTGMVSMFVSEKRRALGHILRSKVKRSADLYGIDIYGRSVNPVASKVAGLREYMYSIVIESVKCEGYFSEKIIDCISQGTIPIYWGAPDIGEYFDINGIVPFNNMDELVDILVNVVSEDDYTGRMSPLVNNVDRCTEFMCAEDWIYKNYPFLFDETS
jgi:hypothetical protein